MFWTCCVLGMSFSTVPYTWVIYPLFLVVLLYPYRFEMRLWIYSQRITFLYQLIFSGLYFFYHRDDILRLELWSDEILSLKISSIMFEEVAKKALNLTDIPPLHYWDLWIWQSLVQHSPAHLSEFIFRIPSMAYHTLSSILFASLISQKNLHKSRIYIFLINLTVFVSFFFNPLLFPFALEVRPYALMVFGGVISMIAYNSKEYSMLRYIPIQLTLFILSIFNILYYIPVFMSLWINNFKKNIFVTVCFTLLIYFLFAQYLFMPVHADQNIINESILRSVKSIQSVFVSTFLQLIVIVITIVFIVRRRENIFFLSQAFIICFFSIALGYWIRYQAFAPRHLILSFPIFIYFIFMPTWHMKSRISVFWVFLIAISFTGPWIYKTEHMITNQLFAPKISIGIKDAITNAVSLHKEIVLENTSLTQGEPLYFTHKYLEEISLWYIQRYTYTIPKRFSALEECDSDFSSNDYYIRFNPSRCQHSSSNSSVLHLKIIE